MKPDFSYKLTSKVSNYISENQMIGDAEFVIVGLSGGADSVCLFLLLNKLKKAMGFSLHAIHINHGIRGESASKDEQFSKELCEKYEVPFTAYKIDVPAIAKEQGLTLEEAGRNVRYECFAQYASTISSKDSSNNGTESSKSKNAPQVRIAVAHHMDDQAETVLFNMLRGSGITGVGGIKPVNERKVNMQSILKYDGLADSDNTDASQIKKITVIRPLLCLTRAEIEEYLKFENQKYCTDETNLESEYSRNTIRNEVMVIFNRIQPKSAEHISAMAEDARDVQEYIDGVVEKLYHEHVTAENNTYRIEIKALKNEKPYIVKQLIIYVLRQLIETYKDITKIHINDIYGLLNKGKGKQIILPYNLTAAREKEYIVISERINP